MPYIDENTRIEFAKKLRASQEFKLMTRSVRVRRIVPTSLGIMFVVIFNEDNNNKYYSLLRFVRGGNSYQVSCDLNWMDDLDRFMVNSLDIISAYT